MLRFYNQQIKLKIWLTLFFSRFSAALRKLIGKALVKRDKDSGILTIHRLIQKQYRYFLEPDERQRAFNNAVKLLSNVVSKSNIEKAQLFDAWENYNKHLQHVLSLRDAFEDERKLSQTFTASDTFCEMLSDYQRYVNILPSLLKVSI